MSDTDGRPELAHMVYFTLKDDSQEAIERQIASCQMYLPLIHKVPLISLISFWTVVKNPICRCSLYIPSWDNLCFKLYAIFWDQLILRTPVPVYSFLLIANSN